MILLDAVFYDANQDTVDEIVTEYGGRIVRGYIGGKPTIAVVFKDEIEEDFFYADLIGLYPSESNIKV